MRVPVLGPSMSPLSLLVGLVLVISALGQPTSVLWLSAPGVIVRRSSVLDPQSPKEGLTLAEATDGDRFLRIMYRTSGELLDCEEGPWNERADALVSEAPLNMTGPPLSMLVGEHAPSNMLPDTAHLLDIGQLSKDCRRHHRLARRRAAAKIRHHSNRRSKRGLRDYLIVPGTNWCGVSHRSRELGPLPEVDACCRRHDNCKRYIKGFGRGYSRLNVRPFTMSSCACDRRFKRCLKSADTRSARVVGQMFFNILQTKCFILVKKEVCVKRSWWKGNCLRFECRKVAETRNNVRF